MEKSTSIHTARFRYNNRLFIIFCLPLTIFFLLSYLATGLHSIYSIFFLVYLVWYVRKYSKSFLEISAKGIRYKELYGTSTLPWDSIGKVKIYRSLLPWIKLHQKNPSWFRKICPKTLPVWTQGKDCTLEEAVLRFAPQGNPLKIFFEDKQNKQWIHKNRTVAFIFILLPLAVPLVGSTYLLVKYYTEIAPEYQKILLENDQGIQKYLDRFLEEQRALNSLPFLQPSTRENDAGPFLNPKIAWKKTKNSGYKHPSIQLSFELMVKFDEHWADVKAGQSWMEGYSIFKQDIEKLDFSWMKKLMVYDHWDLNKNSPIQEVIEKNQELHLDDFPKVDIGEEWSYWAKFRIIKGIYEKNAVSALEEVRHLAKLVYSTENRFLSFTALSFLTTEREAYNFYVEHNLIEKKDWVPLESNTLEVLSHTLVLKNVLFLPIPPETFRKILMENRFHVGVCGHLAGSLQDMLTIKSLVAKALPEHFQLITKMAEKGVPQCQLTHERRLWLDDTYRGIFFNKKNVFDRFLSKFFLESILLYDGFGKSLIQLYECCKQKNRNNTLHSDVVLDTTTVY